jgi:hypothetical protein
VVYKGGGGDKVCFLLLLVVRVGVVSYICAECKV